jgi:PEP-CTERM motif
MKSIKLAIVWFAALGGVAFHAHAGTLSYTFTQSGFTDSAGDVGTLNGMFTGTLETNGTLALPDLTSFNATFSETVNGVPDNFVFNTPNDFFYDPNTPGSLNFSAGSAQSNILLCSGSADTAAICYGINPMSGAATTSVGFFEDLPNFGPSVTRLASAVVTTQSSPGTVPEPGTGLLLAAGAGLLICARYRRRHQSL